MDGSIAWGQFWVNADGLTRLVGLLLCAMSVVTWSVLILKWIQLARLSQQASFALAWSGLNEEQRAARLQQDQGDDPYVRLAVLAQQAGDELQMVQQGRWVERHIDPSDWVTRRLQLGLDRQWSQMQSRLTLLASVGATAPFVGLLGTVWGIYHALLQMGHTGQASIDQVAGPVGEALIMTAIGLAVAIPAVLAYNALLRAGKKRQAHLREFAAELHAQTLMLAVRPNHGKGD